MVSVRWCPCLVALCLIFVYPTTTAFHMHKIMAAALLANSLQRNAFLPLPIPIPIPVRTIGNTIISTGGGDGGGYNYIPITTNCVKEPCYSIGHSRSEYSIGQSRSGYFW